MAVPSALGGNRNPSERQPRCTACHAAVPVAAAGPPFSRGNMDAFFANPCGLARTPWPRAVRRGAAWVCLVGLACLAGSTAPLAAADKAGTSGTSNRQVREEALRSIPLDKLPAELRPRVAGVLNNTSLFRRVPVQVIDCDPDLYLFLARHPEVVVNIWQIMGISRVSLVRTGPNTYQGNDGAGTTGAITLCYSSYDTQIVYAEGAYEGPMFARPLRAQCVLVLRAGYVQETNGRYYITNRLDTFIHIDHAGLELVAKTFNSIVNKTVDVNFRETVAFVGTISHTAEGNAPGMQRLAAKLTGLEPAVRDEFSRISGEIGMKNAERAAAAAPAGPNLTNVRPVGKKLRR